MRATLDVAHARSHFPALDTDWALFDNAGGSVAPRSVIDRVGDYLSRLHVQLGATYPASAEATEAVDRGRRAAARLVNADPDEVVLGPSTTMNVLVLAQALRPTWREGDEIVVSDLDHEANVGAWRRLEATGIVVREWPMELETASLSVETLRPLLNERTRLVCFTHCSNVVGSLHDVAAITRAVHEAGAQVCVDGVAYAPHRRVDVRKLDVDWYLMSLYKVYGPHLGLLYGKRERMLAARSVNHFFVGEQTIPDKLMPGNVVHELGAALPGILVYLESLGFGTLEQTFEAIAAHEERLVAPLLDWLRARGDVRIIGEPTADRTRRVPTVAFSVDGRNAQEVAEGVEPAKVAIRWGHFYAARAIERLGLAERGGIVRASMVHYNTSSEVARLVEALEGVLDRAPSRVAT